MGPVICEWLLSLPECHKMTWTPEWLAKFFLSDKNTADKALDLHLDDCTMVRRRHAAMVRRHATRAVAITTLGYAS